NLNELTYVFNELGLDVNFKDKQIRAELKNYFNEKRKWNSRNELTELKGSGSLIEVDTKSTYIHEDNSRIL
ncbi:hypothetical protein WAJ10_22490, partial [Acinetobacter baumannii]